MEEPVSNLVDTFPPQVIAEKDPDLPASLRGHDVPSREERRGVEEILSTEFSRNLEANFEPTQRGRDIDNMLGAFLLRWPIENDHQDDTSR